MSEGSTIPDPVKRMRVMFESMDRDWDLDAVSAHWAPDVAWDLSVVGLGTYKGVAAIREFIEGWWTTWEALEAVGLAE